MAITPVSGLTGINRGYVPNFGRRIDEEEEHYNYKTQDSTSMVRVPVMVLLAMSPLNSSSVDLYNQDTDINGIEMVQAPQQTRSPQIIYQKEMTLDKERIVILGSNRDNNIHNFEKLGFNYEYVPGPVAGLLDGTFVAIADKAEEDGKYLTAYRELKDGKFSNYKICYLPAKFGYQVHMLSTSKGNNDAVMVLPKSEFSEYFGADAVKNAPMIKNATAVLQIRP